jgi:hypothetical protein
MAQVSPEGEEPRGAGLPPWELGERSPVLGEAADVIGARR